MQQDQAVPGHSTTYPHVQSAAQATPLFRVLTSADAIVADAAAVGGSDGAICSLRLATE